MADITPIGPLFIDARKGKGPGINVIWIFVVTIEAGNGFLPGCKISKIFIQLVPFIGPSDGDADGKGSSSFPSFFIIEP